jgi:hypothetical protein
VAGASRFKSSPTLMIAFELIHRIERIIVDPENSDGAGL